MILKKERKISVDKIVKRINNRNYGKNLFLFVMGMLICSIAINIFFNPNNIILCGTTGLATLLNNYINIDFSLMVFVIYSVILVLSFGICGIYYGKRIFLRSIFFPIFIKATSIIRKVILLDNISLLFLVIIGSALYGIGYGIIKKSGFCMGGFEALYEIIDKKTKFSYEKVRMICNIFMLFICVFVFGIDKMIYSTIALYIYLTVSDRIMIGISRNKAFYIITKNPLDVKEYITNNLKYTVTIVNARGGYSDKKKKMLLCVIPTVDYIKLKEVIKKIDSSAFFLVTDTYEIVGLNKTIN